MANDKSSDFERVVVWVRRDKNSFFEKADFATCFMDYFGISSNFMYVRCKIEDRKVFMEPDVQENRGRKRKSYLLQHPAFCAIKRLNPDPQLPSEILKRSVDVGVSVILESSDGKILVTRRAQHMRTFPGVWVPPGGHIEQDEDFIDAGSRELYEETGLNLNLRNKSSILGLWESTFPPVLYAGQPTRHHLVVYIYSKSSLSSEALAKQIKLDYNETDACVWMNKDMVVAAVKGITLPAAVTIPITVVNKEGDSKEAKMDPKVLRRKMPYPESEVERLSTGTRYALNLWLQKKSS